MKRQFVLTAILAAASFLLSGQNATDADPSAKPFTIVPSTSMTSKNTKVQMFVGIMTVTADQVAMPLTLKISNGNYSGLKFAWVRVFLNHGRMDQAPSAPTGRLLLDERAFARTNPVVLDLTGQLSAGANTLVVQGAGMPGAAINYELTASTPGAKGAGGKAAAGAPKIGGIDPPEVSPGGQFTIKGSGFDEAGNNTKVTIYNRSVSVIRGSASEIVVKVPDGLAPHAYDINVTVNGVKATPPASVDVMGPPEVSGLSLSGIVSGSTVEVYGNNFSKVASKDVVTITVPVFDNLKRTASVTVATKTQLTINVPSFPELEQRVNGNVNTPANLSVAVNGVQASNTPFVTIGIRPMGN